MKVVEHSYGKECEILLKDLTGIIKEITIEEKEELIRSGISYSEMISKEGIPSDEIKSIFFNMLKDSKRELAAYIGKISEEIYIAKGDNLVLVSLARAGTPYGILIKRYLKLRYNIDIKSYSVSIIRGKGIDFNALKYILKNNQHCNIQFVDGWTGKGSIIGELKKTIDEFNKEFNESVDDSLAVVADPAKLCKIYGTRDDIVVPNCCLNSTVSGLISRTVNNPDFIGEEDFHGAKYLDYLKEEDLSMYFIDEISNEFQGVIKENQYNPVEAEVAATNETLTEVAIEGYAAASAEEIRQAFKVKSINSVKLSIGESARVLLRRKGRVVLVRDLEDKNVSHIIQLAKEKNVEILKYDTGSYRCMAIIEEEAK
jgi:hypothetical protein